MLLLFFNVGIVSFWKTFWKNQLKWRIGSWLLKDAGGGQRFLNRSRWGCLKQWEIIVGWGDTITPVSLSFFSKARILSPPPSSSSSSSSCEPARCVLRSRFCPAWWFIILPKRNNGRMIWRRHGCPVNKGFVYMDWSSASPEQIWGKSERWGGILLSVTGGGTTRNISALI